MGRKKKKIEDEVCPPCEKNTRADGIDTRKGNPKVCALGRKRVKDLAKSQQVHTSSDSVDGEKDSHSDVKGKSERKSLKDDTSQRRRVYGRRRIPSESPQRRESKKQREETDEDHTPVGTNGKTKESLSNGRMSRREMFYSNNPERIEKQINKVDEVQVKATVDPSEAEMKQAGIERKSRRDFCTSPRKRVYGRRRIPSESPQRRESKKQREEKVEDHTPVGTNGKPKESLSNERMSRREMSFSNKPERIEKQINKVDEVQVKATVDSSEEEMRQAGIERKSRRDFFNSTKTRRRLVSKSPFKISQRCPFPTCCNSLKDDTKGHREDKNDNQGELDLSRTKDTAVTRGKENPNMSTDELQITEKPKCMLTKAANVPKRRQRKMNTDKRSKRANKVIPEIEERVRSNSEKAIMTCCGIRRKKSKDKKVSSEKEGQGMPKSTTTILHCCGRRRNKFEQIPDNKSVNDGYPSELSHVSMASTIPETDTIEKANLVSTNRPRSLPNLTCRDISLDNYPEELNPFANDSISEDIKTGSSAIADGGTTDPKNQKVSHETDKTKAVDNTKPGVRILDDYPIKHLNPFEADENIEIESPQPESNPNSETIEPAKGKTSQVNILTEKSSKKSKLRLNLKKIKTKRLWLSQKSKCNNKSDTKHSKSMANQDNPDIVSIPTACKDSGKTSVEKVIKNRKWQSKLKILKRRKCIFTNKKSKYTDVIDTTTKDNTPVNCETSATTSTSDIPGVTHSKTKSWRSGLRFRKKKCCEQKQNKIDTHQPNSVDNKQGTTQYKKNTWRPRLHIRTRKRSDKKDKKVDVEQSNSVNTVTKSDKTKKRRWFKLSRKQKKLSQEQNVYLDEKASDNVEDDKLIFKSKYLQDLNPLTASHIKASTKERRVPLWKIESTRSDIKIKQRRWWKFGKRQKSRDMGEDVPKKNYMTNEKQVEESGGKDMNDSPKKKKSILKKFRKAINPIPRHKTQHPSNSESAQIIRDSQSDDRKSSTDMQSKVAIKLDKKGNNSSSKTKASLKASGEVTVGRKLRSTFTNIRKNWKKFNQWLEE